MYRRLHEQRLRDYVLPVIGRRKLSGSNGVTKHDVLAVKRTMEDAARCCQLIATQKEKELSQNTIKGVLSMLSAMFQAAVDEDEMALNPVRQLGINQRKAKAKPQRRMVIVEPDQIPKLIAAAAEGPHYFGVMVFAALFTGMRLGELRGLRWADVHIHGHNTEKPYIVVRGQLLRRKDEDTGITVFEQRGLKSKDDPVARNLRIPRQLADQLRKWRAASPCSTNEHFVFVTTAGSPPSDSTIRSNFYRARTAASLNPAMRFHDMRDTHASMLIRDGRPITQIAVQARPHQERRVAEPVHNVESLRAPLRRRDLGRRDVRATGSARRRPLERTTTKEPRSVTSLLDRSADILRTG